MRPTVLLARLSTALLYLAVLGGMLMSALVVVSVVMRYLLTNPLRFTEELVGVLFAALVFLTLPAIAARRQNIRVTLVVDRLPRGPRRAVGWLANLLSLVFFVWFGLESYEFAAFSYQIDARSDIARLPLVPWMALLPASSLLVALILLAHLLRSLSGIDDEEEGGAEGRGPL